MMLKHPLYAGSYVYGRRQEDPRRKQLERPYHRFLQQKPRLLSEAEREPMRCLATDIPALWAAPTTKAADHKEIIRKAR
jgi:hypothetical protein